MPRRGVAPTRVEFQIYGKSPLGTGRGERSLHRGAAHQVPHGTSRHMENTGHVPRRALVSRPSLHVDGEQHVPPDGRGLARDARGTQRLRQRKETHMKNTRVKLKLSKESVRVLSQPELREAAGGAAPTNACRPSIRFACTTALSCGGGCDTA